MNVAWAWKSLLSVVVIYVRITPLPLSYSFHHLEFRGIDRKATTTTVNRAIKSVAKVRTQAFPDLLRYLG